MSAHTWPHERAHPACDYRSWSACDKAWNERLGRCQGRTADKQAPQPCNRWAHEEVAGIPFCVAHAQAKRDLIRDAVARGNVMARIDGHIARTAAYPSVDDDYWG